MSLRVSYLVALSLGLSGCASRNAEPAMASVPCRVDPSVSASVAQHTHTLLAIAELSYSAPDSARHYAVYLLEDLGRVFRLPSPLDFTAWTTNNSAGADSGSAVPTIAAEARVVIRPNGRLHGISIVQTSLVPSVDSALVASLRLAIDSGAVPAPSTLGVTETVTLFVALTTDSMAVFHTDTARPSQTRALTPPPRVVMRPLMKVSVPSARFSKTLRYDKAHSKPLDYPVELRSAYKDGDVIIQAVFGADGRVVPGTVRLVGATERGFAEATFRFLRGVRFFPAEIDGCRVPVYERWPLSFRIIRP